MFAAANRFMEFEGDGMIGKLRTAALLAGLVGLAAPAGARNFYCYAYGHPDHDVRVLVSDVFSVSDDTDGLQVKNDWYRHVRRSDWSSVIGDWGCVGPYDSSSSAQTRRMQDIQSYRSHGWPVSTAYGFR